MKLKGLHQRLRLPSLLWGGASVLILGACGPKTTGNNPINFAEVTAQGELPGSSINDQDALASDVDANKRLKELLEEETAARISADGALKLSIDAITERIDSLEAELRSKIAELESTDDELREMIIKETADRISDVQKLKQDIANLKEKVEDYKIKLEDKQIELAEELKKTNQRITDEEMARKELEKKLADTKADLEKSNQELADKLEQRLNDRIDQIEADLEKTNEQLAEEQKARAELESELADAKSSLQKSINDKAKELKDLLAAEKIDLENKIAENKKLIDSEREARLALDLEIDQVQSDLEQSQIEMEARLKAEFNGEIARLEQELDDFKLYAAMTYATKEELKTLSLAVENLNLIARLLNDKIDANDKNLDEKIAAAVADATEDLSAQISAVSADVDSIRNDLNDHIASFNKTVNDLYAKIIAESDAVKQMALKLDAENDASRAKLAERLKGVEKQTAGLIFFVLKTKASLVKKIRQLEAEDAALSAEIKEARGEAAAKLAAAIAEQDQLRLKLQQKVASMAIDLEKASKTSQAAYDLALANKNSVRDLRGDLEAAKDEFSNELKALESRMNKRLKKVKVYAESLTKDLSAEVRQQFTEINGRVGELEQRVLGTEKALGMIFSDRLSMVEAKELESAIAADKQALAARLKEFAVALAQFEKNFIDVIDPILKQNGIDVDAFENAFAALAVGAECAGNPTTADSFASVQGKEFFFHLSRQYVHLLFSGIRSSKPSNDAIFQGLMGIPNDESLAPLVVAGMTGPYSISAEGACHEKITSWSRGVLLGDGASSKSLRAGLQNSAPLLQALVVMYEKAKQIESASSSIYSNILSYFVADFGSEALAIRYLTTAGDDQATKVSSLAALILEVSAHHSEIAEIKVNRERFIALARELAEVKASAQGNSAIIDQFQSDLAELNKAVAELSATVDSFQAELKTLKSAQMDSFSLISAIAARLGYDDLVAATADSAARAGVDIDESLAAMPASCVAAQHFYNHATDKNLAVTRCESNLTYFDKPLSYSELTRCAIHGNYGTGSGSYTWGNQSNTKNGWLTKNRKSGGHKVGNGLRINHFDPTDTQAIALASRSAGSVYPQDGQSTFVLRVFGRAAKFKIDVTSMAKESYKPYSVTVDASTFQAAGGDGQVVYEIPLPKAIQRLGGCRWDREIKVVALDENDVAGDRSCLHRFHTFSPIVFNLGGDAMVNTIDPEDSEVKFDLDANGLRERLGWVGKGAGLLALDLNGNGKIDDGRELFGEATKIAKTGERASDGYLALAQYDSNADQMIDGKDAVFSKLKLWVDLNQNGKSESHELKTMKELGIKAMAVSYKEVAEDKQIQSKHGREANIVKFESRYWGPKQCGIEGCASYDVFFGSTESTFAFN